MQREGSAFQGLGVVMLKELADHLTSVRLFILELLVIVIAMVTVYFGATQIKASVAEDPFLFLRFFTVSAARVWLTILGSDGCTKVQDSRPFGG